MTAETLYDAAYFREIRGQSELYALFLSLAQIDDYRKRHILDIGCGRGELIQRLIEAGCQNVSGLDFSNTAIAEARRTIGTPPVGVRLDLQHGSAAQRDLFLEASFDFAFMTDVVEHLSPDILDAALRNARLWLKHSGRLLVHTFPTLGLHRIYQRIIQLQGDTDRLSTLNSIHCNVQTRKSLRDTLERAGFTVERIWLRNDFTLTSTAYKQLKPGLAKSLLGGILDHVLGSAPVRAVFGEYAAPSIYAISRPS